MEKDGVFVFPNIGQGNTSSLDPNLLLALNNGGGFGNNGNWIWILFLWLIYGNGYGRFGNQGGMGVDYLANQMNNDAGRDLLLQAINGRADCISQLATMTNSSIDAVRTNLFTIQSAIQNVGSQIGMSGLEIQNAIMSGNASLSKEICACCCENRLAIANQTAALQAQMAQDNADVRLQMCRNEGANQLAMCQQTNNLTTQSERNTSSILNAIAGQNALITKEFCELKERELQSKIDTQSDIITQLRGQISNDAQTAMFNAAICALNEKITALAAKQPNTVPVVYPNLVAVQANPCGCTSTTSTTPTTPTT